VLMPLSIIIPGSADNTESTQSKMGDVTKLAGSEEERPTITVFGSSQPSPGSAAYEQARKLGRLLAEAGLVVANGGYSGTMEGVSRGAAEAGGKVVGITCALFDGQRPRGNPYLSENVHAPDLLTRLRHLTDQAHGFVILGGGTGTLLELLLVWNLAAIGALNKPCILVGAHWQRVLADLERETEIGPRHIRMLQMVDTPEEAVSLLRSVLASERLV
jgi:uncharacterized protein (TIGR00730 family)